MQENRQTSVWRAVFAGVLALTAGFATAAPAVIPPRDVPADPAADVAPAAGVATYPDVQGFAERSDRVLRALATHDLDQWRRGFFAGGDPGKYLPTAAIARLLINPNDPDAARLMNDERSYREHYHFAAVNWARFVPLFGKQTLTDDTRAKLTQQAARYGSYLNPSGTENHKTMSMTSANVLPTWLDTGLSNQPKAASLDRAKQMLRDYVRGLYAAGQGEWDSCTYMMFDVNGMLNIYDFAEDPEARLLARAALDWLVAGYAIKYRDGIYLAPHQRGFAESAHSSIADQTGYVWFGSSAKPDDERLKRYHYAVHAITSSFRPSKVLHRIATKKDLPALPAEFSNTKPNYWYGQGIPHRVNAYAETVYVAKHYSIASLWNGFGGQITRLQIVADGTNGGIMFTGGHPRRSDHTTAKLDEFGYSDGLGRYDQSAQVGGTLINLSLIPADEPIDYAFFTIPEGVTPRRVSEWLVMRAGQTHVAVRAAVGEMSIGKTELTSKQLEENKRAEDRKQPPKHVQRDLIHVTGRPAGFVVETADTSTHADDAAFDRALQQTKLVPAGASDAVSFNYTNLAGKTINFSTRPNAPMAAVSVDGAAIDPSRWDWIYRGPFVRQTPGVLEVNDGSDGFVIDFTGDLPKYSNWKPKEPK